MHRTPGRARAVLVMSTLSIVACTNPQPPPGGQTPEPSVATSGPPPSTAPTPTTEPPPTSTSAAPAAAALRTVEVTFAAGKVVGGARRATVALGERVRIVVTSDIVDEVHLHTYDLTAGVRPGQVGQLELTATIPGRHQVELENKGLTLLTLEVR